MNMTASTEEVRFHNVNLCPLSPAQINQLSTFNLLRTIAFSRCLLLSVSISNDFMLLISAGREHNLTLYVTDSVPCDRATFALDDDGITQFLCSGDGKYERKLDICHANASERLPLHLESVSDESPYFRASELIPRHVQTGMGKTPVLGEASLFL